MAKAEDYDGRFYIVVVVEDDDGAVAGLSRRTYSSDGTRTGPWGLLTMDEAAALARAWNDDSSEVGEAVAVAVHRYAKDPIGRRTDARAQ